MDALRVWLKRNFWHNTLEFIYLSCSFSTFLWQRFNFFPVFAGVFRVCVLLLHINHTWKRILCAVAVWIDGYATHELKLTYIPLSKRQLRQPRQPSWKRAYIRPCQRILVTRSNARSNIHKFPGLRHSQNPQLQSGWSISILYGFKIGIPFSVYRERERSRHHLPCNQLCITISRFYRFLLRGWRRIIIDCVVCVAIEIRTVWAWPK